MEPIVIINAKAYPKAIGDGAKNLASYCAQEGAWISVQTVDLKEAVAAGATVLAQHVDPVEPGAHTGAVLPEAIKQAGAHGTLINHSERRLTNEEVEKTIARCKEVGLYAVVCAESIERATQLQSYGPDLIAVEIPELIGGDVSIVTARPGIVSEAVKALGDNVLLGAGVNSHEDLSVAVEQGAKGVILASAVAQKTDDPHGKLKEILGR